MGKNGRATVKDHQLWITKIRQLDYERALYIKLHQAMQDVEVGIHSAGIGLTDTSAWALLMERLEGRIRRINLRQEQYTQELGAGDGGAGDREYLRDPGSHGAVEVGTTRGPLLDSALLDDAKQFTRARGLSLRSWLEGLVRAALATDATPEVGEGLPVMERLHQALLAEPKTYARLVNELLLPGLVVRNALFKLRQQGLVTYEAKTRRWLSREGE